MIEAGRRRRELATGEKKIATREWYDFVGSMADVIPALHLGDEEATSDLLEMCSLTPETRVLDIGRMPG